MHVVFIFCQMERSNVFHKGTHEFQQYVSGVVSSDSW